MAQRAVQGGVRALAKGRFDGECAGRQHLGERGEELPCALRAGASYNYLLVNGERRMTEREMLRIQGFPESFKIVAGYSVVRKQAGNSVPVPLIRAVITAALHAKPTLQDTPNTFPESTQQLLPFGEDLAVAGAV